LVQAELDKRNLVKQSDIWIYPVYPEGFTGVVAMHDLVYIFEWRRGECVSIDVKTPLGIRENGSIIF
jgi:hypothetical protein